MGADLDACGVVEGSLGSLKDPLCRAVGDLAGVDLDSAGKHGEDGMLTGRWVCGILRVGRKGEQEGDGYEEESSHGEGSIAASGVVRLMPGCGSIWGQFRIQYVDRVWVNESECGGVGTGGRILE